jgi:type 1 fimbria pilin
MWLNIILIIFLSVYANITRAEHHYSDGGVKILWDNIDLGRITVQKNVPVGTLIHTLTLTPAQANYIYVTCTGQNNAYSEMLRQSTGVENIYTTGISGVGIKVYVTGENQVIFKNPRYHYQTYSGTTKVRGVRGITIELYKTGDIVSGAFDKGKYFSISMGGLEPLSGSVGAGEVIQASCTVTNANRTIPLGRHKKQDFSGPESTSPWTDFDISLNCSKDARINVRFDAKVDNTPTSQEVIKLDSAQGDIAATGVGIQLGYRSDNSLVEFGKEKYYWTASSDGNEVIQLRARYYQTQQKNHGRTGEWHSDLYPDI